MALHVSSFRKHSAVLSKNRMPVVSSHDMPPRILPKVICYACHTDIRRTLPQELKTEMLGVQLCRVHNVVTRTTRSRRFAKARRNQSNTICSTLYGSRCSPVGDHELHFSQNCLFQIQLDLRQLPLCLVPFLLNSQCVAKACQSVFALPRSGLLERINSCRQQQQQHHQQSSSCREAAEQHKQ